MEKKEILGLITEVNSAITDSLEFGNAERNALLLKAKELLKDISQKISNSN